MTVNERLYEAKLMSEFDDAANKRDVNKMIAILIKTDLTETQAQETTNAIIDNPSMYGY